MDEILDCRIKKQCPLPLPSSPQSSSDAQRTSSNESSLIAHNSPQPSSTSSPLGASALPSSLVTPNCLSNLLAAAVATHPLSPSSLFAASSALFPCSPTALLGGGHDPSFFPTASLALSTLHRRRQRISNHTSQSAVTTTTTNQNLNGSIGDGSGEVGNDASDLKKGKLLPEEKKDDSYWERRRKNNEAAKRSRDSRRQKEEEIAVRAAVLEQENLKLRAQVAILKNETARLHCMLFAHVQSSAAS